MPNGPAPAGSAGDMFLHVKGARFGVIKGESQDGAHKGEIDVLSWSWGLQARPSLGGGGASGKPNVHELRVVKFVDSASTALMSAVRTNELIIKAVLTVRKAGRAPLEYLRVIIEQGRVTGLTVEVDRESPRLVERLSFSFNKISVEYTPQGSDGQPLGGMVYSDEFGGE